MLQKFLEQEFGQKLRDLGFRRRGLTWLREVDGVVDVVNFQRSRFSVDKQDEFTINLGVFHKLLWNSVNRNRVGSSIKIHDCFPRMRIGEWISRNNKKAIDIWWNRGVISGDRQAGPNINLIIDGEFESFFSKMRSSCFVVDYFSSRVHRLPIYDQILFGSYCIYFGFKENGNDILSRVKNDFPDWEERVDEVLTQTPEASDG